MEEAVVVPDSPRIPLTTQRAARSRRATSNDPFAYTAPSLSRLGANVYSVDVHAGQRLAATGIAVQHCGQSLVAGAGAGAGGAGMNRFTCFTIRKITNAMIKNSITVFMKRP